MNRTIGPAPKPALSPSAHLAQLAEELDWLYRNVATIPAVTPGEATDIRNVIVDLGAWARLKAGQARGAGSGSMVIRDYSPAEEFDA